MLFKKAYRAFTLIEVLIVIAILAIIAIVIVPSFLSGNHQADVSGTTQQIIASLRLAQSQSAQQVSDAQWGVHFSNATNTAPFYAVFSGPSYASGTVQSVYRLPADVGFTSSTISMGSTMDVIFSPISGAASIPAMIQLYNTSQPTISSTISVLATGEVEQGVPLGASGDIWAAASVLGGNNSGTIQEFSTSGSVSALNTVGIQSPYCGFQGAVPEFVTIAPNGNIYVTGNNGDQCILEFNASGTYLSSFSANGSPTGIAVAPSGNIYYATFGYGHIYEANASGTQLNTFGSLAAGTCQLDNPDGLALDAEGDVYVTDYSLDKVAEFSSSGTCLNAFGSMGSSTGQFSYPIGIAIGPSGNIYVSDAGNSRVEEFSPSGTYLSQFGSYGATGLGTFESPTGIAIDGNGNIYVANAGVGNIEKFNSAGAFVQSIGNVGTTDIQGVAVVP